MAPVADLAQESALVKDVDESIRPSVHRDIHGSVGRRVIADRLNAVCWTPDGDQILGSSMINEQLSFYNFKTDSPRLVAGDPSWSCEGSGSYLRWKPEDRSVFAAATGRTIRLFDRRKRKQRPFNVVTLKSCADIIDINWHPSGQFLCAGTKDNSFETMALGYLGGGENSIEPKPFPHEINEFCWDSSGKLLLVTTGLGTVQVFDWAEFVGGSSHRDGLLNSVKVSASNCICISCLQDSPQFAVGCANSLLFLFDIPELICTRAFSSLDWPIRSVRFSRDGRYLASTCENRQLVIYDLSSSSGGRGGRTAGSQEEALVVKFESNKDQTIPFVAWHPSDPVLAFSTSTIDGTASAAEKSASTTSLVSNISFWMPQQEADDMPCKT